MRQIEIINKKAESFYAFVYLLDSFSLLTLEAWVQEITYLVN